MYLGWPTYHSQNMPIIPYIDITSIQSEDYIQRSPAILKRLTEPDEASKRQDSSKNLCRTLQYNWAELVF